LEIESLRDEVLHKWRQPIALYITIVTCSVGAAVQGWDQTGKLMSEWPPNPLRKWFNRFHILKLSDFLLGSNGANLTFPDYFHIGTTSTRHTFLVGLINAAPYIGSAFIGCWFSDPLNSFFGRRGTIFVSANFCLLSVIGTAFTQTWEQCLICRLLLGVGMGAKASTVPIFAAENSPAAIRGALVMSCELYLA
jgi:MFS family permease